MAAADERDRAGRTRVLEHVRAVRWPERRSRELAVITAIFALIIVVAFPKLATGSATFAPNGRLATQSGSSGVDYHYKTPGRAAINDAGGFAWSFEPWVRIVHNAYSDGALPLWNPYTAFGAPLAARYSDGAGRAVLLSAVHSSVATGLEPGGAAAPAGWRGRLLRAASGAGSLAGCRVRSCCRIHALHHVRPVDARRVHEPGVAHAVAASRHPWHDSPPDDRQVLRAGRPHDADVRWRPTRGADRRDVPRHRLGTVLVDT